MFGGSLKHDYYNFKQLAEFAELPLDQTESYPQVKFYKSLAIYVST